MDGVVDMLRAWLAANDPRGRIRCLVLTKGLAHRILDTDGNLIGYRHLDTAWKYGTEEGVGEGIRASGVASSASVVTGSTGA